MRVFIASDHAGFQLKEFVKKNISKMSFLTHHKPSDVSTTPPEKKTVDIEWTDLGPTDDSRVDYPDFAEKLANQLKSSSDFGILICGSGIGMCIKANRYPWIRAGLASNIETAALSRQHNDANVLCLGARFLENDTAIEMVKTFLTADFEGGRHGDRVKKL